MSSIERMELAYDSLMSQAEGDYVTDIKVREKWTYAFVGTVYCTELEATAYPRLSASGGPGKNGGSVTLF